MQRDERPLAAPPLSRRRFLALASSATAALWIPRAWASPPSIVLDGLDLDSLAPFEREHLPQLRLPAVTTNGAKLPIVVELDHPMAPDHYITKLHVVNLQDPVPLKGTFHLTPANGRAYVSFQARVHHGASRLTVTAECNRHGSFTATRTVVVPDDGGG
jgi:sulfur-oxidizing protein SoxY